MERNPSMLTVADIAAYLNVCERTVYRWCHSGKIPFYSFDSTLRFDATEIEKWVKGKRGPQSDSEEENAAESGLEQVDEESLHA